MRKIRLRKGHNVVCRALEVVFGSHVSDRGEYLSLRFNRRTLTFTRDGAFIASGPLDGATRDDMEVSRQRIEAKVEELRTLLESRGRGIFKAQPKPPPEPEWPEGPPVMSDTPEARRMQELDITMRARMNDILAYREAPTRAWLPTEERLENIRAGIVALTRVQGLSTVQQLQAVRRIADAQGYDLAGAIETMRSPVDLSWQVHLRLRDRRTGEYREVTLHL